MVAMKTDNLTEDEAELYDRQIRLWGIESQKRLRSARILIIGANGLGAEIAKNIILTGVQSVTLMDSAVVTQEDASAQFLIPHDAVGTNRAEASMKRAQALNPMVKVTADVEDLDKKPDGFFGEFDVVFATGCRLSQLKRINNCCRAKGVQFFCGAVLGMLGFGFADLLDHEYMDEITKQVGGKSVTTTRQVSIKYSPLEKVITTDWSDPKLSKRLQKMDYLYFLMIVILEFGEKFNRAPDRTKRSDDITKLKEVAASVLASVNAPADKIPEGIYEQLFGEVSPVCAILGGVLAQDIIRAVSHKEKPLHNFFFFNPEKCYGYIESLGVV